MRVALLLMALLVATSFASETEEVISNIHRIDQTEFGRYLLDQIYMQLETGNPLDRLLETLHDLEERYFGDQKEDDSRNSAFQNVCNQDIAQFDRDLATLNDQRILLQNKLEDLQPQKSRQLGILAAKKFELQEYQKVAQELDTQRSEENVLFEEKMIEHQEAIGIIRQAKDLFEENLLKQSFLEKKKGELKVAPSALVQVQKHFSDNISYIQRTHKHKKAYGSILKVLMTISSKLETTADQGAVARIINLCARLLDQIQTSLDFERYTEDRRIVAYKMYRGMIQRDINAVNTDIANAEATLQSINDAIFNLEQQLHYLNDKFDILTQTRTDRYTECEEAAHDYQGISIMGNDRDGDRQTVSDLIGILNKNLRELQQQIALRVAAGDLNFG